MWCAEVAAGDFMIFLVVVSGDIGHHGRLNVRILTPIPLP